MPIIPVKKVREHGCAMEIVLTGYILRNKAIFSGLFPRNPGDIHVDGHGRWYVAIGEASCLAALELVQCLKRLRSIAAS